ncbi:MAG TPA: HAMP domain-containing sensor histidine kinase [Kofleriaceae bacterium]|nr:HAMP domain-containing sensor histidine kinase [Kofleriaceae bacterium]
MAEGAQGARHRPRITILVKLLAAFALPTSALFALFAVLAHEVTRRDLEAELGTRLAAVAASAATQIRGATLAELQPGDEEHLLHQSARRKLAEVAQATGVARLYIFDREFRSRADTADDVPIGTEYYHAELDRQELERVFGRGDAVSSVLFEGKGGRLYKAGYAPLHASDKDASVVLAIGVDAPATFFERLADLRRSLVLYGLVSLLAMVIVAVVMATVMTRPVRHLAAAAERIGRGDLDAPVARTSRDEIGFLAETMEEMRRDLRARDERMQEMLSGIAHEVRNPLGGIELFAGILRDEIPDGDERRAHVARIEREVTYLKRVVAEFLDYARRPQPEMAPVRLGQLAEDICELEAAEAAGAEVELTREVDDDAVARGDGGQLRRALHNLVRNAIQAAGAGERPRRVRIGGAADGETIKLSVHNTGAPIPAESRDRLFEPFFTTREKGTGLGLAFVREIVQDHGGQVEIDSADGRGTTFTLVLPRSA